MNIVVLSSWKAPVLVPTIEALSRHGIVPTAILFDGQKDERSLHIHRERTAGFIDDRSVFDLEELQLPAYFVRNHNSRLSIEIVQRLHADLLINGGVRRILRQPLLDAPAIGVVNAHPGILPKYRGCTCVEWAIFNDDPIGATCHFMNGEIDAGPIVCSEIMEVGSSESYESVRARMISHCATVLAQGIGRIRDERLSPARMTPISTESYFDVMPDELLAQVRLKLSEGRYHSDRGMRVAQGTA